jgi:IS5 family transposase
MAIVPDAVMSFLSLYLGPLLVWFSERVYSDLLQRDPGHLLRQVQRRLDLKSLERVCADFHHISGPGTLPTHPVPRLVRALLVGYLYNWSLRQLEWQIRFNLIVKWFVGYPLGASGPDHTTLERFELWVCERQHRAFFDTVLRQIDAEFPDERGRVQLGDTFALRANAGRERLIRLIRHLCQCLLRALKKARPELTEIITTQHQSEALFGAPQELGEYWLDATGCAARLQTTVLAARACATWVRAQLETPTTLAPEVRRPIEVWLKHLEKLWADEVTLLTDDSGQVRRVSEASAKGHYRFGSATDPDVTYRVHGTGETKSELGYNVQVITTDDFVREIQANTGAQPDDQAIPQVLQAQHVHHAVWPAKLIYDTAAGTGKTRAQVTQATQGHTQLVAPLPSYEKRTALFTPDVFTLSADGMSLTCPNGQTTTLTYRSGSADGRMFHFFAHRCADCPVWSQCRRQKPGSQAARKVFISDYRAEVEAARAYNQTDAFRTDMHHRAVIERLIAALVRYQGARQARRRGQVKADFQMKMCATVYNLKKWMRHLARRDAVAGLPV